MQAAIDQIRELRALHEDGLLSRMEFDERKDAILDVACAAPVARPGTEIGLMAGQELGPPHRRYRLERLIAHGGMAQVWQATDLATHAEVGHSAQVALKVLAPQATQRASHAKLLIQEAARARRLAHEHIVRVYDWAQDPATGSYFIIMEFLEGEDLATMLERERQVGVERALSLLDPVAAALDHAWDRHRLVHRDIKPANVFVTSRGDVKLLDFGIAARARGSGAAPALEAPASSGTAGYRAPEAGVPRRHPERTLDVYAVAVMLCQMVGGAGPSGAPAARPPVLPDRQWAVLQAGFSSDPAGRPASVRELLDRLRLAGAAAAPVEGAPAARVPPAPALLAKRREREKAERLAAEAARRARREELRRQLHAHRAAEAEKAQRALDEAGRRQRQARVAAAYLAEQPRAREDKDAVGDAALRDRFLDGSGAGPALVRVPAGRFQMGSPAHERKLALQAGARPAWLARETPQHWVGIARPFAMGRHPVCVGEWRAFVAATGWRAGHDVDWQSPGFAQADSHPVVGVSWHDAQAYVAWLSACTGKRYRLPSEAEWEYACRAGTRTAFSFGDTLAPGLANYDAAFSYNGSPFGAGRAGTTPAGAFAPNPWGLCDMHGNVWEWVQDRVHDTYDGAPTDGSAWEEGGDPGRRILRGGSWLYHPRYLRSALRNGFAQALANDKVGFRVVRELD